MSMLFPLDDGDMSLAIYSFIKLPEGMAKQ